MVKGRKAQITVFMIVGIILLFSSALLFYIRGQIVQGIPSEFVPTIEEVPLEAQPIKVFVEDCIRKVATDALLQIGLHGGYISPKDRELSGNTFLVGLEPTESDALAEFDNENALMPYWWYLRSPNDCSGNCEFGSNRPPLSKDGGVNSIEGQLDNYIDANLNNCLMSFNDFKARGIGITERGVVKADARATEKEVIILVNYPISMSQEGRTTDLNNFFSRVDLNLKEIYNFATDILNSEAQMFFLELHAMNSIAMYSRPSSMAKIPPIADYNFDIGDRKLWTRTETQRKVESNVLAVAIPELQIDQSRNFVRHVMVTKDDAGKYVYDKLGQGIMDKTIVSLNSSQNYTTLAVEFNYLDWWPIYLNINDQEVLGPRSTQGTQLLSFLGFNEYRFWYDVSFPVKVRITAPAALEGRGYTFQFALEANIRDNNHTTPTYVNFAKDTGKKLACSRNQRNTDVYTIETRDALTKRPVSARVDFVLGNEACFIGFSAPDEENKTKVSSRFPVGMGALRVNNVSYILYESRMLTRVDKGDNVTVDLMPYRYINASIFKKAVEWDTMRQTYLMPGASPTSALSPGKEKAFMIFKRIDNDSLSGFSTYLSVSSSSEQQLLKMVPGTYEVRGFIFYESDTTPIRINAETINFDVMWGDDVNIVLNETVMDPYPKGGIIMNNVTGYLKIDQDKLFGSSRVVFYLVSFPPPITHSESLNNRPGLEQMSKVEEMSQAYKMQLQPDWLV